MQHFFIMMKFIFNPGTYSNKIDILLFIIRAVVSLFMLTHGTGKLFMLFSNITITFSDPLGMGATSSLILTVFSEVVCSLFLLAGLATRLAVVPLIFTMLIIVFVVLIDDGFNEKELPLFYLLNYLVIFIAGAGKYSVDKLIFKKLK